MMKTPVPLSAIVSEWRLPMDTDEILATFKIPTPCPMDWDLMRGDDRVRFCQRCGKDVYNLTAMNPDVVASLLTGVRERGERRCVRLYQRPDGTLTAAPCQPALHDGGGPWRFTIRAIMTVIAACATLLGLARWGSAEHKQPKAPPPAGTIIGGDVY
jgi:hypothetical protein